MNEHEKKITGAPASAEELAAQLSGVPYEPGYEAPSTEEAAAALAYIHGSFPEQGYKVFWEEYKNFPHQGDANPPCPPPRFTMTAWVSGTSAAELEEAALGAVAAATGRTEGLAVTGTYVIQKLPDPSDPVLMTEGSVPDNHQEAAKAGHTLCASIAVGWTPGFSPAASVLNQVRPELEKAATVLGITSPGELSMVVLARAVSGLVTSLMAPPPGPWEKPCPSLAEQLTREQALFALTRDSASAFTLLEAEKLLEAARKSGMLVPGVVTVKHCASGDHYHVKWHQP